VTSLTTTLFRIDTGTGLRDVVALTTPDEAKVGGLSQQAIVGAFDQLVEAGTFPPERFVQNPGFVRVLHSVIKQHAPTSPALRREAERLGQGWVYVIDRRCATPGDRVPPEDVLGVFAVRGGAALPASYTPSPNYRLLTERGFFQLEEHLVPHLLAAIRSE
jgi:hypothetical protein